MNTQEPMIRQTSQRQVILEELSRAKSHPTATDLYDLVRKRLPRIGLGTIYRNLDLMADKGLIRRIDVGGNQRRFDAITKTHYHIRCTCCGKVENLDIAISDEMISAASRSSFYKITGHSVEFTGECQKCQQTP
jgi:Fur family transcriptional regulator, ferric uptake regulator